MSTIVGFTGTRKGMTENQRETVRQFLEELKPSAAHHGGCIGADEEFHHLCLLRLQSQDIHIHWSNIENQQMRKEGTAGCIIYPPDDPLVRNKRIVKECHILIAAPSSTKEELRSGTWATIREGRRKGKKVMLVGPDGSIT